jgi:hypothetical protein
MLLRSENQGPVMMAVGSWHINDEHSDIDHVAVILDGSLLDEMMPEIATAKNGRGVGR